MEKEEKVPKEEVSELKEDLKDLIEHLVAICPAHNSVTRILRDTRGMGIDEVSATYGEIFGKDILPILTSLFGYEAKPEIGISSGTVGTDLLTLVDRMEETYDKDEVRSVIARGLGEEIPENPVRVYVEECVETLEEKDPHALRLLLINSQETSASLKRLTDEANERYSLGLEEKDVAEHMRRLDELGLLSRFSESSCNVKERYRRHVIDLIEF